MTDYLKQLDRALTSPDTISPPTTQQLTEADVYARAAQAHALTRIANALETIAADTTPTVRPAIHHSA